MDIATKPVERCNIVASTLGITNQTATFQQLLCLSNKIAIHVFEYYSFLNTGPIKHCKNVFATLGPTQPSYNFPGTLHLRSVFAGVLVLWFLTVTCSWCPYLYFGSLIM